MIRLIATVTVLLSGTAGAASVPFERLVAEGTDGNWLTYSGSYRSERFLDLDEINRETVAGLKVLWAYQMQPTDIEGAGLQETTPLVVDGIMYLTESPSSVTALDADSGRMLWHWSPQLPEEVLHIGFPKVNRGVAILDDTLFVGTLDARLFALDAGTGAVRWETRVADNAVGFSLTLAPLALPMIRQPESVCGEPTRSRPPVSQAARPGAATAGRPAADPPG
jgi:glucose dehydrogenase